MPHRHPIRRHSQTHLRTEDSHWGPVLALICTPSVLATNGANGECGTGTCRAIQGVGLCTYASSQTAKLALPPVTTIEMIATNPTHYGDPKGGCESDEQAVQVQGVSGDFCSPKCKAGACPTDIPSGDTAKPTCALKTPTGDQYCALICTPSVLTTNGANGECGTGTCQAIQGVGLCTYASSQAAKLALPPVTAVEMIATNPTHYG